MPPQFGYYKAHTPLDRRIGRSPTSILRVGLHGSSKKSDVVENGLFQQYRREAGDGCRPFAGIIGRMMAMTV
jgi:hypothetical protein